MRERQFISFKLNDNTYGVEIQNIGGVIDYTEVTTMPNMPEHIEGVINLRGAIIPIINLKKLLKIRNNAYKNESRIILYQLLGKNIGYIVDEASQVFNVNDDEIDNISDITKSGENNIIHGIAKRDGKITILLDFSKILNLSDDTLKLLYDHV